MPEPQLPACTPLVLRHTGDRLVEVRPIEQLLAPPDEAYVLSPPQRRRGAPPSEEEPEEEPGPPPAPTWEPRGDGEACALTGWEVWSAEGWTPIRRLVRRPTPPRTCFLAVATPTGVVCAAGGQRYPRTNLANGPAAVSARGLVGATLMCVDAPRPTKVAHRLYLPHDFGDVALRYAAAEPPGQPLPPLRTDFLNPCPKGHRMFARCVADTLVEGNAPVWVPGYHEAAAMFQVLDSWDRRVGMETSRAPGAYCVRVHLADGGPPVPDGDRVLEVREVPVETDHLWGLETDAPWHHAGAGRLLVCSL